MAEEMDLRTLRFNQLTHRRAALGAARPREDPDRRDRLTETAGPMHRPQIDPSKHKISENVHIDLRRRNNCRATRNDSVSVL